jgi:excisionase family DNA binding protein
MLATLDIVKDPVTTKAAAELLDVSRSAVLKAIKYRRLQAEPFGRDYWIEREEVERYLRERKMTGPRRTRPTPTD